MSRIEVRAIRFSAALKTELLVAQNLFDNINI